MLNDAAGEEEALTAVERVRVEMQEKVEKRLEKERKEEEERANRKEDGVAEGEGTGEVEGLGEERTMAEEGVGVENHGAAKDPEDAAEKGGEVGGGVCAEGAEGKAQ